MAIGKERLRGDEAYETVIGLPDDFDAWMTNCRFGVRDEYAQQAIASGAQGDILMFLTDLVREDGEFVCTQGWSVGSGWVATDDGLEIDHATRVKIVNSSLYGQFIDRVKKGLGVKFEDGMSPFEAKWWNGYGFHWNQTEHATLREGEKKTGLMPTAVLTKKGDIVAKGGPMPALGDVPETMMKQLRSLAQTLPKEQFVAAAVKIEGVSDYQDLFASVVNTTEDGFWAKNQE